ncbi:hypothetical protein HPB47_003740 [Ixodes persulcatus]|uniref:Uncharacterized protein n=1 Tax=Ixodes persulcatus TaxID=34615 RepID=A0AC60PHQ2_IXOPE|nr:hypothetical protein HPB47_003740 [Ixodes persulcatus]
MSAQLTRLLGTKAGQAIIQEIGRLPSSAPKPPPLPAPPWERHVTLTADAPLPRRMDADHPERTGISRQGVGIKSAELESIVQVAHHAEQNHSETSTTNITIYTDSQVAYSECRHASESTIDRVNKIYGIASRLHFNHHTELRVAWVPANSAHNEARAALSKPSALIVTTIFSGPHFDSSQPDDSQPDLTKRAALAKLERKKILRNLRTAASLFNRHNTMIPRMPAEVSRKSQTLVRHTATNTLTLLALRNRIFQDAPQQGYCTACNTLATTQHVIWECPDHAAARFEALADIPQAAVYSAAPVESALQFLLRGRRTSGVLAPMAIGAELNPIARSRLWSVWRRFAAPDSETAVGRSQARLYRERPDRFLSLLRLLRTGCSKAELVLRHRKRLKNRSGLSRSYSVARV